MMKRLFCLLLLLTPLAGCAGFDDFASFGEYQPGTSCGVGPVAVRACDGSVIQAGASLPAQTAEPPH
jgi:hypothetical protein